MSASKQFKLSKQYLNTMTADVFFVCGIDEENKEEVPAHKFLLVTSSDVFETMFHGSLPEGNAVLITDASANGFRAFLRYFYFDEYALDIDVVGEVMYLAKKYNISEYLDVCCAFLKGRKTAEHILLGFELAIRFDRAELKSYLEREIVNKNDLIFCSTEIRNIDRELLKNILEIKFFKSCTKKLFDACMAWAEEACQSQNIDSAVMQNRRNQLGACFELIEFGAMRRIEIMQCVTNFGDLFTCKELQRIVTMISAKCPTPFNADDIIKLKVGVITDLGYSELITPGAVQNLLFSPQIKMLLGGITILPIHRMLQNDSINSTLRMTFSKVSLDKDTSDDIVICRVQYGMQSIIDLDEGKDPVHLHLPEPVIFDANSNYVINLEFLHCAKEAFSHKQIVTVLEEYPVHILSGTNCTLISALMYNRLF